VTGAGRRVTGWLRGLAARLLGCGCGAGAGRHGVVDRPDADRVGLVTAGGGHAGEALRYYARQFALVEVDGRLLRAARRADRRAVGGAGSAPKGWFARRGL
jgi:hypothetical protein